MPKSAASPEEIVYVGVGCEVAELHPRELRGFHNAVLFGFKAYVSLGVIVALAVLYAA
jgi:hypothetical protein